MKGDGGPWGPHRVMRRSPDDVFGLAKLVAWADPPPGARMLEVGSFAGESAALFALTGRFASIVCVDYWKGPRGEAAERHFDQRAKGFGLTKWKVDSSAAAHEVPDGSLDLVYIDAEHDLDSVTRDIRAWLPKVRPGGVLSGHDYLSSYWTEVRVAVDSSLGRPHATFSDESWAVRVWGPGEVEL